MASEFTYAPDDSESEKASNSYLMSIVGIIVGLPLPIINMIATTIFFLNHRDSTYFVRWHCTQSMLSQTMLIVMNTCGVYWTYDIIFSDGIVTNHYIAYLITIFIFNAIEFFATIYAATVTRKGKHVEWWLFGPLTNSICKP